MQHLLKVITIIIVDCKHTKTSLSPRQPKTDRQALDIGRDGIGVAKVMTTHNIFRPLRPKAKVSSVTSQG